VLVSLRGVALGNPTMVSNSNNWALFKKNYFFMTKEVLTKEINDLVKKKKFTFYS